MLAYERPQMDLGMDHETRKYLMFPRVRLLAQDAGLGRGPLLAPSEDLPSRRHGRNLVNFE